MLAGDLSRLTLVMNCEFIRFPIYEQIFIADLVSSYGAMELAKNS